MKRILTLLMIGMLGGLHGCSSSSSSSNDDNPGGGITPPDPTPVTLDSVLGNNADADPASFNATEAAAIKAELDQTFGSADDAPITLNAGESLQAVIERAKSN